MKRITLLVALLTTSLAMAAQTRWKPFPSTKSPNGRLAIAWKGTDEATNALIKVSDATVVATLTRPERWGAETVKVFAQTEEASGMNGIKALWSADSSLVVVLDQSKRGTNALELVSATGKKYALYAKIKEEASRFLTRKHGAKFSQDRQSMNFVCATKQLSPTKLVVSVNVWSNMSELTDDVELTCALRVTPMGILVTSTTARQGKAS